jgi:hypothetical protein
MPRIKKVALCHPERPHKGRNMCNACYSKWQVSLNPERYKAYRTSPKSKERLRNYVRVRRRLFPERYLLAEVRSRSRKLGLECNLEISDISIPKVCPILGIPLTKNDGHQRDNSASIDRINLSKGYVRGNIAIVSMRANRLKNNATLSEMLLITDYMLKHAKIGTVS